MRARVTGRVSLKIRMSVRPSPFQLIQLAGIRVRFRVRVRVEARDRLRVGARVTLSLN